MRIILFEADLEAKQRLKNKNFRNNLRRDFCVLFILRLKLRRAELNVNKLTQPYCKQIRRASEKISNLSNFDWCTNTFMRLKRNFLIALYNNGNIVHFWRSGKIEVHFPRNDMKSVECECTQNFLKNNLQFYFPSASTKDN